jgi:hypothetical protein
VANINREIWILSAFHGFKKIVVLAFRVGIQMCLRGPNH